MKTDYEAVLRERIATHYDIEESVNFDYDLLASLNQRSSKYLATKNIEFYAFQNNEYILYKKLHSEFTMDEFERMQSILQNKLDEIIEVNEEHMSSVITFLYEANLPKDRTLIQKINKFKFYKSFKFGLKGWVNVRLIVIDPIINSGLSNRYGRGEMEKFIFN